jgi:hypothetical protein
MAEPPGEGDLARVPGKLIGPAGEHHPGVLVLDDRHEHRREVLLRAGVGPRVGVEGVREDRPQVIRSHLVPIVEEAVAKAAAAWDLPQVGGG